MEGVVELKLKEIHGDGTCKVGNPDKDDTDEDGVDWRRLFSVRQEQPAAVTLQKSPDVPAHVPNAAVDTISPVGSDSKILPAGSIPAAIVSDQVEHEQNVPVDSPGSAPPGDIATGPSPVTPMLPKFSAVVFLSPKSVSIRSVSSPLPPAGLE